MPKDPAFLFYPGDYLRDTQCLSEAVQVAYDRIMCEHMRNICITHAQLNFFTKKLNAAEVSELKMVLTETDNGFQIDWVVDSITKRKAYSQSRRDNRAKKTTKDMNNISKTYVSHMEIENEIENNTNNKSLLEIYFKDLPNSSHIETIAITQKISKEKVLSMIPDFIKRCDLTYKDFDRFATHFKNWIRIELSKPGTENNNTTSLTFGKKRNG